MKILRECPWKYYLTYYQAWEGWLSSAPQEKQRAYMLKNMTNLPMWVGSIVHDIIEEIILEGRATGKWCSLESAQKHATQRLRKGWKQSIDKRWQVNPKQNVNLAEHFYQEEIQPDSIKQYKQKVLRSLKAFYDMPLFQILCQLEADAWLSLEDFQKFQLNTGEEVTVKIDCGFIYQGKVYLLDWKTGKVNDSVIDQLVTYAMYALKKKWATKPDDIIITPVYLAAYTELGEQATPHLEVTMRHMQRQAGIIRSEYPLLTQAHENRNDPSYFEHTDNERACKKCHFREICSGAKTEVGDNETPF